MEIDCADGYTTLNILKKPTGFYTLTVKVLVTQSCPTLCNPRDYSPPGPSVHGILQARILQWAAISSSRGIFLTQGSNLGLLHWQADSLPSEPPGKPLNTLNR